MEGEEGKHFVWVSVYYLSFIVNAGHNLYANQEINNIIVQEPNDENKYAPANTKIVARCNFADHCRVGNGQSFLQRA